MNKIENILNQTTHKHQFKSTTTIKFKKDLIEILLGEKFEGDILEVGSNRGHTSVVLGAVAEKLNKNFYGFEFNKSLIHMAESLSKLLDVKCNFIQKDVYNEDWGLENIGFIFIDCMHTEECFEKDLHNSFNMINDNGLVAIHDYGLIPLSGDKIKNVVTNNLDKYEIVRYLGEEKDWNKMGSGQVIDWEGVLLKRKVK